MELIGAKLRNILDMCKDMNSDKYVPLRVNIPHYQRPYKWEEEQIKNLIYDFQKNIKEESNKEYFVGSVVLVKNTKKDEEWQDIIDGQQRVTTVFLLNYLRFLLLRALTEDLIIRKSSALFSDQMTKLISCYTSMFGTKKGKVFEELKEQILNEFVSSDKNEDEMYDKILDLYQKTVGLPAKNLSDEETYKNNYEKELAKFLNADELALSYSRKSYNLKLKRALSKVMIIADKTNQPKLILNDLGDDQIVSQYINALQYEFDALKEMYVKSDEDPLNAIKVMINAIAEMIESVTFCVIMTGNENDAYTLFEVLNDRAMKVDDLDLIKNLFLKMYCNNSGEDEFTIDKNVSDIDVIWGEEIFSNNVSQSRTKLISYLGTIYLTADEDIYTNKVEKYREVLDKKYLSIQYANKNYTALNVKNDIKIYQMIKVIFEEFSIPANQTEKEALKAELDNSKSITYKTVHLVNALNQMGVLAAITNLIVRTYIDKQNQSDDEIAISKFKDFVIRLRNDSNHIDIDFVDIHKWSFEIWKTCLLAKDYSSPRKVARKIVQHVSVFGNSIKNMMIDWDKEYDLKKEFLDWTDVWQYGSTKQKFRVRILFVELFGTYKDNDKLRIAPTRIAFNTDKLQLDHLDAQNPDKNCLELYYKPNDPTERREKIINGIGNIMILDQDDNNQKNNVPLMRALEYYDKMCPSGHWLLKEIQDMIKDCRFSTDVTSGTEVIKVPNDDFFKERRKRLQMYFYALLSRKDISVKEMRLS